MTNINSVHQGNLYPCMVSGIHYIVILCMHGILVINVFIIHNYDVLLLICLAIGENCIHGNGISLAVLYI